MSCGKQRRDWDWENRSKGSRRRYGATSGSERMVRISINLEPYGVEKDHQVTLQVFREEWGGLGGAWPGGGGPTGKWDCQSDGTGMTHRSRKCSAEVEKHDFLLWPICYKGKKNLSHWSMTFWKFSTQNCLFSTSNEPTIQRNEKSTLKERKTHVPHRRSTQMLLAALFTMAQKLK